MKKSIVAGMLALFCALGSGAEALQPALGDAAPSVVEAKASRENIEATYPVWTGGTILAHAKVNSTVETEIYSFYQKLPKTDSYGIPKGYVSWQAGACDHGVLSYVLVESTMMPRAAHPSHYVVGLNFRDDGSKITYADVMQMIPQQSPEEIRDTIRKQTQAENIPLFEEELSRIQSWPKNFYIGNDGGIYFIFQTYDIAPYAAGWIGVRGGTLKSN